MIGYSIGFACVPFLLLGEMLPARMRNLLGAAVSRCLKPGSHKHTKIGRTPKNWTDAKKSDGRQKLDGHQKIGKFLSFHPIFSLL
jgi:hypothetical protein